MAVYERVSIGSLAQGAVPPSYTFTRSTAARYVDSDGLLKWAAHNLLTYSEQFDNAAWSLVSCLAFASGSTANAASSPIADTTAEKIVENTSNSTHGASRTASISIAAGPYCASVYMKAGERTVARLRARLGTIYYTVECNLSTGATTTIGSEVPTAYGATDAGGGWWRVYVYGTSDSTTSDVQCYMCQSAGVNSYTGDGTSGIYLWGAQLNYGSTATAYLPTTSAARYDSPRRQWDATNRRWGHVGEGSRTNLLLRSQEFDNASWAKTNATCTANQVSAPDGTTTGDLLTSTASGADAMVVQNSATTAVAHTVSVYVRQGTASVCELELIDQGTVANRIRLTFATGAISNIAGSASSGVEYQGGGWYRIWITYTFPAIGAGDTVIIYAGASGSSAIGESIYVWGAQLEAGPAPSSYIPTTTVAVTRGADLLTRALTGPEGTALSTQGTMVVEFSYLGGGSNTDANNRYPISIDNGGDSERIVIYNQSGTHGLYVADGGVQNVGITIPGVVSFGVVSKVAATWKLNDVQFSRDGAHGTRDTSATMPTLTRIGIAGDSVGGRSGYMLVYGWTIYDDHYPTDAGMDALTTPTTNRNQSRLTLGLGLGL